MPLDATDPPDLKALERRALELMRLGEFSDEAIRINAQIVALAPKDEGAWTRLGRCHLEQRQFDEAVSALRAALSINPLKTIATNLLAEVRKRRALAPTAGQRPSTGFSTREFAFIETLRGDALMNALRPRMAALFDSLNASAAARLIVEARQRAGATDGDLKLFHPDGYHAGAIGHLYAFHHGGRWEPQFNLGWFASPDSTPWLRIGLGFRWSAPVDESARSGGERLLKYFERFQRSIATDWRRDLTHWMNANSGFIQYGHNPPALDLLPERAIEWLLSCESLPSIEWAFVGRWLFLDRSDDARVLADRAKLATTIDDTFRALLPLWLTAYGDSPVV